MATVAETFMGCDIHVYAEQQYSNGLWRTGCRKSFPNSPSMYWVLFQSMQYLINTVTGRRGLPADASGAVRNKQNASYGEFPTPHSKTKRKYSYMSITELKLIATDMLIEVDSGVIRERRADISRLLSMFELATDPEKYKHLRIPLFSGTENTFQRLVYYYI